MKSLQQEIDIAKHIHTVEWLKAEIVGSTAALFRAMLKDGDEQVLDALTSLVIATYVLGRRLGHSPAQLDANVAAAVRRSLADDHEVEKWYGDLTALLRYLEKLKEAP